MSEQQIDETAATTPEDGPGAAADQGNPGSTPAAQDPALDSEGSGEDSPESADDSADSADSAEIGAAGPGGTVARLEREGDIAADYLEELLDIADLDGDLDMDVEGDRASVSIVGAELSQLVGRDGEVLDALQELTRLAVYRETGERSRLMLDISGHRAGKRESLVRLAEEKIAEVRASGSPASLEPMSAFERKVVHDAVSAAGLTSESEGVEPRRWVVILPS